MLTMVPQKLVCRCWHRIWLWTVAPLGINVNWSARAWSSPSYGKVVPPESIKMLFLISLRKRISRCKDQVIRRRLRMPPCFWLLISPPIYRSNPCRSRRVPLTRTRSPHKTFNKTERVQEEDTIRVLMLFRVPELVHTLRKITISRFWRHCPFFQDNDNEPWGSRWAFKIASLEPLYPGILGP